jgi:hypothetical protein
VTVEQNGVPVARSDALVFRGNERVVEIEIRRPSGRDLIGAGRGSCVDRLVRESARGTQFRVVGAGVKRRAARIAIEVDDVTRMRRNEQRRPRSARESIQLADMPVGIRKCAGRRRKASRNFRWHKGSRVRDVDDQRRVAARDFAKIQASLHCTMRPARMMPRQGLPPIR